MNDLIKLFKQHAGIADNPDQAGLDIFAELIVAECANWLKNTDSNPDIGEEDAQALREHFGI